MDSTVFTTISSAVTALTPLFVCAIFVWVIWRTESRYVLVRRAWQLVHGNQPVSDPEVQAFIDEQSNLASFRMFSGVRVTSLEDARQLIRWTALNKIPMSTLRVCGEYFDGNQRAINTQKIPGKGWQRVNLFAFILTVISFAICISGIASDKAILSFKSTQRLFFAEPGKAGVLWPWTSPLRIEDCSSNIKEASTKTTFTEEEVRLLCELIKSENGSSYLKNAVKSQRQALFILALAMGWASSALFFAWTSAVAASNFAQRRISPELAGHQLSLDLEKFN